MAVSFREALKIAQKKYPYRINHYEEYEGYFVFDFDDGAEYVGGDRSPIVIRKSDFAALNYAPIFSTSATMRKMLAIFLQRETFGSLLLN